MTTSLTTTVVRAENAHKVYGTGETMVTALDNVTISIPGGQFTAIMGPSGSGKSTLMHCLAGLDNLTAGQVFIGELELGGLSDRQLTQLRRDRVGFVFQAFNLLPTLSALDNITLPITLAGTAPDRDWLEAVIATVDLSGRLSHRPAELSQFLRNAQETLHQTIVMVTHDPVAASYADTAVFLADGRLEGSLDRPTASAVLDYLKTLEN